MDKKQAAAKDEESREEDAGILIKAQANQRDPALVKVVVEAVEKIDRRA